MLRVVKVEQGVLQGIPAADPRITVFKGVPFENAQQFETATDLAYRANACFNNSILFLSIADMDRSKKYMEELFEIITMKL